MTTIPTISQLYVDILADLQNEYGANISTSKKVFLRAVAAVQSAKLYLFYAALGNLQKNIFVDTADSESQGGTLERWGRIKLGRNPNPAVQGQYSVTVTGSVGGVILAQTTFKSDDDSLNPGMLFILDNDYTLVSTTDTITLRALTSGEDSKLNIGDTLTSTIPIALVDSSATIASNVVQPLSAEDLETYRQEIINSYRLETQGGSVNDYRLWSQDAQGVKKVYPYARSGFSNEINLFVESVVADSTDGKGTPSQLMLDDVESVVELNPDTTIPLLERGRRPLGVLQIHYLPIQPLTINITITGYQGITNDIKALLLTAITDGINSIRPFVAGGDILSSKNDILDVNKLIGFIITSQPGAVFTTVSFTISGNSSLSYRFLGGEIPWLNSITYN